MLQPGIINEHVDLLLLSVLQQPLNVLLRSYVKGVCFGPAARIPDLNNGFARAFQIHVGRKKRMPLLRQAKTQALTQSTARTRDKNIELWIGHKCWQKFITA